MMNRRGFSKSLAALAAVAFLPFRFEQPIRKASDADRLERLLNSDAHIHDDTFVLDRPVVVKGKRSFWVQDCRIEAAPGFPAGGPLLDLRPITSNSDSCFYYCHFDGKFVSGPMIFQNARTSAA